MDEQSLPLLLKTISDSNLLLAGHDLRTAGIEEFDTDVHRESISQLCEKYRHLFILTPHRTMGEIQMPRIKPPLTNKSHSKMAQDCLKDTVVSIDKCLSQRCHTCLHSRAGDTSNVDCVDNDSDGRVVQENVCDKVETKIVYRRPILVAEDTVVLQEGYRNGLKGPFVTTDPDTPVHFWTHSACDTIPCIPWNSSLCCILDTFERNISRPVSTGSGVSVRPEVSIEYIPRFMENIGKSQLSIDASAMTSICVLVTLF